MKQVIQETTKEFWTRFKEQAFHVVSFAFAFMILGTFVPQMYYTYFDKTNYYETTDLEIITEKVYACEDVEYVFSRSAREDLELHIHSDLLKVLDDDRLQQVYAFPPVEASAGRGDIIIRSSRKIPCDVEEGTYIIRFFYNYEFKGSKRIFTNDSPPFIIERQIEVINP